MRKKYFWQGVLAAGVVLCSARCFNDNKIDYCGRHFIDDKEVLIYRQDEKKIIDVTQVTGGEVKKHFICKKWGEELETVEIEMPKKVLRRRYVTKGEPWEFYEMEADSVLIDGDTLIGGRYIWEGRREVRGICDVIKSSFCH